MSEAIRLGVLPVEPAGVELVEAIRVERTQVFSPPRFHRGAIPLGDASKAFIHHCLGQSGR